jgi:hypothetical protein
MGRLPSLALGPRRPVVAVGQLFPRAGPISLTKNHFLFSINTHDEKHFGKYFLGHFSSKNGEINFYVLI